jgi:hypothetical protein
MKAMLNLDGLAIPQSGFYLGTSKEILTQKSSLKLNSRAGNLGQFD